MLDIDENRRSRSWSNEAIAGRILWALAWPVFRLAPRPLWGFRSFILKLFGAHVGSGVHVFPSVRITIPWNLCIGDDCAVGDRAILYALGQIKLGDRVTISQNAHLCAGTHDFNSSNMDLLKTPIEIGNDAWICADAFVGPGVKVGDRAIVGARAVVTKDVDEDAIVAGNPAKRIGTRHLKGATS